MVQLHRKECDAVASIYRRGKIWWVHYLLGGKSVSRSLGTTSERIALEKKRKLEALDVVGQLVQPYRTSMAPFLQSFCEFLNRRRIIPAVAIQTMPTEQILPQ